MGLMEKLKATLMVLGSYPTMKQKCSELRTTAINEIRVLAECWRMGYQHNSRRLRHLALDQQGRPPVKHQIILSFLTWRASCRI